MLEIAIIIGGVLSLGLGILHSFYDRIFSWEEDFKKISITNAKVLYTIHIFLIPFFFFYAFLSFVFTRELAHPQGIAIGINGFYALFWFSRGLWQVFYFHPAKKPTFSWKVAFHFGLIGVSGIFVLIYLAPLVLIK